MQMLSSAAIHTFAMLLALALLATLPAGAQCVVQCANPDSPPPCHHHAPAKHSPPPHACAAEMLPGETRSETAPAVIAAVVSPLEIIALALLRVDAPQPLYQDGNFGPRPVLRI